LASSRKRTAAIKRKEAEVVVLPARDGLVDVKALVRLLGERKITSLLVEGGGEVNASFLKAGLVDKAFFCIAPKIFGGRDAKTPVEGEGVAYPAQATWLKRSHFEKLGEDLLVSGYL